MQVCRKCRFQNFRKARPFRSSLLFCLGSVRRYCTGISTPLTIACLYKHSNPSKIIFSMSTFTDRLPFSRVLCCYNSTFFSSLILIYSIFSLFIAQFSYPFCFNLKKVLHFSQPSMLHEISQKRMQVYRARIFLTFKEPGINFQESILPAYAAWRAGTMTLFLLGS